MSYVEIRAFSFVVTGLLITRDDTPVVNADTGERHDGSVEVRISAGVLDREDGSPRAMHFTKCFPTDRGKSIPDMVRELLIEALTHEVDECLHVDGVRVRDPHPFPSRVKVVLR